MAIGIPDDQDKKCKATGYDLKQLLFLNQLHCRAKFVAKK